MLIVEFYFSRVNKLNNLNNRCPIGGANKVILRSAGTTFCKPKIIETGTHFLFSIHSDICESILY